MGERVTVGHVRAALADIAQHVDDDEYQHGSEDRLHQAVLEWVAKEATEPFRSVAAEALKSLDMTFSRWCA